jgi:hypothetical protein
MPRNPPDDDGLTEFGIFSDEGQVEAGFYSAAEAQAAIVARYEESDGLAVLACCHEHPMQPSLGCEECPSDDADHAHPRRSP